MDNLLLVAAKEDVRDRLAALLATLPQVRVQTAVDAESAVSCAQGADPALVLIVSPLDEEERLCRALLDDTYASVVLLTAAKEAPDGVIALESDIDPPLFLQLLQIARQSRRRFLGLRTENAALHNKLSGEPRQMRAHPVSRHRRGAGAPLYRKAGDGSAGVPHRDRQRNSQDL